MKGLKPVSRAPGLHVRGLHDPSDLTAPSFPLTASLLPALTSELFPEHTHVCCFRAFALAAASAWNTLCQATPSACLTAVDPKLMQPPSEPWAPLLPHSLHPFPLRALNTFWHFKQVFVYSVTHTHWNSPSMRTGPFTCSLLHPRACSRCSINIHGLNQ